MPESPKTPEHKPGNESQEIADMLRRDFGEISGFDELTLADIAAEPFGDALDTAYSYLTQAGLPDYEIDEVLAPWMERGELE